MAASTRFASQKRIALAGSEKSALTAKAQPAAKTAAARGNIIVSVVLKCKAALPVKGGVPQERLTRAAYASKYGADPESKKLVKAFAKEFGLKVVSGLPPGPCTLQLTGSVAAMQKAFGVTLQQQGELRLRSGSIYLPAELEGHVNAVLGLDNRPQAKPHFRPAKAAAGTSYTPVQVATALPVPGGSLGQGTDHRADRTRRRISRGGHHRLLQDAGADRADGHGRLGWTRARTHPAPPAETDGEVMLDIEVSAAVAPGAAIAVYFAPNTDQGFIDAISTAVHDTTNKPSVISISWGGPESSWTAQSMAALDTACQARRPWV